MNTTVTAYCTANPRSPTRHTTPALARVVCAAQTVITALANPFIFRSPRKLHRIPVDG